MKLTKNLSLSEFACNCKNACSAKETADYRLVQTLQKTVDYFESQLGYTVRITITSGNRCVAHNKAVGGAANSKHVAMIAADIQLEYLVKRAPNIWQVIAPATVYAYLDQALGNTGGLKLYATWVHVDMRTIKWRSK